MAQTDDRRAAPTADRDAIRDYRAFWPYYLTEHAKPATRNLHYFGTALGLLLLTAAVVTAEWWLIPAAVVSGYAFAWIGHAAIERNRPATFSFPLWSLASDFRMFFLWLAGRLTPHLAAAGVGKAAGGGGDAKRPTDRHD